MSERRGRTQALSRRSLLAGMLAGSAVLVLAGCSTSDAADASGTADSPNVRIGFFPNVTHAPALVAQARGLFDTAFGAGTVSTQSFNAGPDVIQAILGGSLDISYIGPNPTVTAYAQSRGEAVRVIAGCTSGGAALVVDPSITTPAQLAGTKLASPQLGNTQDVALRYWLSTQGLTADVEGGGDVAILPQKNSAAVQAFSAGEIDGAWLPEPYATALVRAGGVVLVDERTLWPDGAFVTTDIIVRTEFLQQNPAAVTAFLNAHLDALDAITADPARARADVAAQIKTITEQDVEPDLLSAAWQNLSFTADPLAATLRAGADHAEKVGLLKDKPADDFAALWNLDLLNKALRDRGLKEVTA